MNFYQFPINLAEVVISKWNNFIVGEYSPPPLPNQEHLRYILEVVYLAGMQRDETRNLKFFICCTPKIDEIMKQYSEQNVESWRFNKPRSLSVQEIRKLCVATELDTSAIWVIFSNKSEEHPYINGLLNLGSTWSSTRKAFSYTIDSLPNALLIRSESPGNIKVYQGNHNIASLKSGKIEIEKSPEYLLGASAMVNKGLEYMRDAIIESEYDLKEAFDFEYLTYQNVLLAIINHIKTVGHGGTIIVADKDCNFIKNGDSIIKFKYKLLNESNYLKERFVDFINIRNKAVDMESIYKEDLENVPNIDKLENIEYKLNDILINLIDTCKFIGNLASTDGALIIHNDFTVEGFGCEILTDKTIDCTVYQVKGPFLRDPIEFNLEKKGMRHRSAMRLCATLDNIIAFIVSQDGGVTLVWKEENGTIYCKTELRTTNVNMLLP